ncbi:MAG: DASH family cryptochrome [Bacteroidia bacterium]|nr:DASH family cryptochrome [Bacteroidia bacterium]MCX7764829.1 DASH family cryptochrome [Bacteroidia bacterium]MDW8057526.1 DASH family cryptochrome [Bacteroidia bacterium]
MADRVAIWLLNDLRLHDHPALQAALKAQPQRIEFVYIWGPPVISWGKYSYIPDFPGVERRISLARERFVLESLLDLARRVPLTILHGEPDEALPAWAAAQGISAIYAHKEWAVEEQAYQQAVEAALRQHNIPLLLYEGNALYESAQLPFPIEALPLLFTRFRQLVERTVQVKAPLPEPSLPSQPPNSETIKWIEERLAQLPPLHEKSFPFQGGEKAGQQWVKKYFTHGVFTYKETRNSFYGETFSSHFSPWLAVGCLSPRWVYAQLREAEKAVRANDSTYWLFFELLWREYFRWLGARWGRRFFAAGGLRKLNLPWRRDETLFRAWVEGQTGYPIVDAAMRELKTTGWTSNRARQIVASFFTKNLFLDWRWGAAYFETQLIDYDVYSNWGNWLYQAGVGTDGRGFRWFDPVRQAKLYDTDGSYIRLWIPELRSLSAPRVYMPEPPLRRSLSYPMPVVDWQQSLAYAKDTYWRAVKGEPKGNQLLKLFQDE